MVLSTIKSTIFYQHPISRTCMHRSMPFFPSEMCIFYCNLITRPHVNTLIPVVEFTIPNPTVFEILHTYRLISIVMDFIFMVDELFRIIFPIAGKQNILDTTMINRIVRFYCPIGRLNHFNIDVNRVFKAHLIPLNFSDCVDFIDQHSSFITKQP
ncbi:hypothetical protein D3C80_1592330 [compost metagenome]